ncbi:hypothetical protein QK289_04270 [Exiguobacterium antarcticum]|uniref:Uncharacterized protein n=1 Tax=Exiguobacterium antarcticum TaxID=132920 RepID=A0ABT6QZV0_9BACL|nr:hypothetical protein [Exiguobacterium antarcticum]MDI3234214.1 hypothetical protein [Exiguobacterium antarcticum]
MSTFQIPIIKETKNYWLVRTNSGRYYDEFLREGYIGINWNDITYDEIDDLDRDSIIDLLKERDPDVKNPSNAARQLVVLRKVMQPGDAVIITGPSSYIFSIGEVEKDGFFTKEVEPSELKANPRTCPYTKRRKVRWVKTLTKWEVEMPMFKMLQHSRQTIAEANDYKDIIEGKIHDFYIRGEVAQLTLKVRKEGNIPALTFFSLGKEVLDLAEEFISSSAMMEGVDINQIETKININSPGSFNFKGNAKVVTVIAAIVLLSTGGSVNVPLPNGTSFEAQINGIIPTVDEFLNDRQERDHRELLIKEHMKDLEVESPDDLKKLMDATENESSKK